MVYLRSQGVGAKEEIYPREMLCLHKPSAPSPQSLRPRKKHVAEIELRQLPSSVLALFRAYSPKSTYRGVMSCGLSLRLLLQRQIASSQQDVDDPVPRPWAWRISFLAEEMGSDSWRTFLVIVLKQGNHHI